MWNLLWAPCLLIPLLPQVDVPAYTVIDGLCHIDRNWDLTKAEVTFPTCADERPKNLYKMFMTKGGNAAGLADLAKEPAVADDDDGDEHAPQTGEQAAGGTCDSPNPRQGRTARQTLTAEELRKKIDNLKKMVR